jgi:ParB/RepB/Spo0J family partition protein
VTAEAAPRPRMVGGVVELDLGLVDDGPNARGVLRDVDQLATSIRLLGQFDPVVVDAVGDRFVVFDGHRRVAALRRLNQPTVLAVVRRVADENRTLLQVAIHSTGRDFDPIAQARAIAYEMFERPGKKRGQEEVAEALGRTAAWVAGRLQLLNLPEADQVAVSEGRLSVVGALQLLRDRSTAGRPATPRRQPAVGPVDPVRVAGPVDPAVLMVRQIAALVRDCVGCSCCRAVAGVIDGDAA